MRGARRIVESGRDPSGIRTSALYPTKLVTRHTCAFLSGPRCSNFAAIARPSSMIPTRQAPKGCDVFGSGRATAELEDSPGNRFARFDDRPHFSYRYFMILHDSDSRTGAGGVHAHSALSTRPCISLATVAEDVDVHGVVAHAFASAHLKIRTTGRQAAISQAARFFGRGRNA
jgi:hypothetical protein